MQRLESSIIIRKDPAPVWEKLCRPESWANLFEAFAGWEGQLSLASPTPQRLQPGSEITLLAKKKNFTLRCRVAQCIPLRTLEIVAIDADRFLTAYHVTMTLSLDSPNPQTTVASMVFTAIFLNRFVELLSLILPVHLLYARRLRKALAALEP